MTMSAALQGPCRPARRITWSRGKLNDRLLAPLDPATLSSAGGGIEPRRRCATLPRSFAPLRRFNSDCIRPGIRCWPDLRLPARYIRLGPRRATISIYIPMLDGSLAVVLGDVSSHGMGAGALDVGDAGMSENIGAGAHRRRRDSHTHKPGTGCRHHRFPFCHLGDGAARSSHTVR